MSGSEPDLNHTIFSTPFSHNDPNFKGMNLVAMDDNRMDMNGIVNNNNHSSTPLPTEIQGTHDPLYGGYSFAGFDYANHFATPGQRQVQGANNHNNHCHRPTNGVHGQGPSNQSEELRGMDRLTISTQSLPSYFGLPPQPQYMNVAPNSARYDYQNPQHMILQRYKTEMLYQTRPWTAANTMTPNVYSSFQPPSHGYWHSRLPSQAQTTISHASNNIYYPAPPAANRAYPGQSTSFYQPQLNSLAPLVVNPTHNSQEWQLMRDNARGLQLYGCENPHPVVSGVGDRFSRHRIPLSPLDASFPPIARYLTGHFTGPPRIGGRQDYSPRFHVLRACGQCASIPMNLIFDNIDGIYKVNEGVFGEVYAGNSGNGQERSVYKVVPIEGRQRVNGERQKRFHEIETEIRVSQRLNVLRNKRGANFTEGFCHLYRARLLHGCYPRVLIKAWQAWNRINNSDNDFPNFGPSQLYVVFEYEHCGTDAETFTYDNAEQAYRVLIQIAFTLAVAESGLRFEHRDLHWGNILVSQTEEPFILFRHEEIEYLVPSGGLMSSIIDFTIARCDDEQGYPIFDDLKHDEIQFGGYTDYQFEIYRMMRRENKNNWRDFRPKSNIFWLKYLCDKFLKKACYEDRTTSDHMTYMAILKTFEIDIMKYASCSEFIKGMKQYVKRGLPSNSSGLLNNNGVKPMTVPMEVK